MFRAKTYTHKSFKQGKTTIGQQGDNKGDYAYQGNNQWCQEGAQWGISEEQQQ